MNNKKIVLLIINVVVKLILLLLVVEFILQIISYSKYLYAYHLMLEKGSQKAAFEAYPKLKESQASWPKVIGRADPFLGWTYNVQSSDGKTEETERQTANNPIALAESIKKVFMFGGSTTWGAFVSDENTIPSLLSGHLNAKSPSFAITNYGQLTYTSNQEIIKLLLELKKNNIPDYLIFYDGCNEYLTSPQRVFQEKIFIEQIGDIDNFLWRKPTRNFSLIRLEEFFSLLKDPRYIKTYYYPLQIYKKLSALINRQQTPETNSVDYDEKVQYVIENYTANAALIDKLAEAYDFKYLLIWQPLAYNKQLTVIETKLVDVNPKDVAAYQKITSSLNKSDINQFVDLTDAFVDFKDNSVFIDQCHLTSEGNEIMAEKIYERLINYEWAN